MCPPCPKGDNSGIFRASFTINWQFKFERSLYHEKHHRNHHIDSAGIGNERDDQRPGPDRSATADRPRQPGRAAAGYQQQHGRPDRPGEDAVMENRQ